MFISSRRHGAITGFGPSLIARLLEKIKRLYINVINRINNISEITLMLYEFGHPDSEYIDIP